ncbi:MAG: multicomponent Na+:H+ antiporter subunit G [Verrucomicrobiales bacterium]|jgi:multicomponent Na+:H+ antiporter subunit G
MTIGILDIASIVLVLAGLLFFLGASIGLLRFPDFYTRMHAAGKGDTLSTLLIMGGVCLYELNKLDPAHGVVVSVLLIVIKILAIGVFIMLTSPTSTHALMKAGYDDHIEPVGELDEMEIEMPALNGAAAAVDTQSPPEEEPAPVAKKVATKKTTEKKKASKKVSKKKAATAKKKAPAKKKSTTKKKAPRREKD